MNLRIRATIAAATILLAPVGAAAQHEHDHGAAEKLGRVSFPVSCKAEVRESFERGVALLHSFAYAKASQAFTDVAEKDPACAMAQWGIAMSRFHAIWGPPPPAEFSAGKAAAAKAAAIPATTDREKGYVAAIGAFYQGDDLPHAARVVNYEKAMAEVAARHPQDHEAAIFHALAILAVAYNSPPDKTYARQKQAAEILNGLLPLEPEHPGIAHYMIHSFDYPALAELALPAARAYAKIAPSAPHALHMPSHIFTRLGMWRESIQSNLASAEAARKWAAQSHPGATAFDALHAMDYLVYAYLQTGQDAKARQVVDQVAKIGSLDSPELAAGYALAAIPARYALERRSWKEAAAIEVPRGTFPWEKFSYAEAIIHFARAVGAARAGDADASRAALQKLASIQAALQGQKGFDWAAQVEIQRLSAAGWLARAQGKDEEARQQLRSAAELEDRTDKHPVTPGSILPAREQLADLLAELGQPAAALAEYETSLRSAPGRLNSIAGAARAAARAGEEKKAESFRRQLTELCAGDLPPRAETRSSRADTAPRSR
ncbi:MAG TPA: hypothetical protein VGR67_16300 [Candidatus Polarisedimenticolia bacterium]|nr:hypothetical protein [Candidatus Polarisedimenticolia bacterium]